MEERSKRRCLRNNTHCVPMENIFKNNDYILNSASDCIPPQIISKLKRFQTITCEDINSLTLTNNQSHANALERMSSAAQLQKNIIEKGLSFENKEANIFPHNAKNELMSDEKQRNPIKNEEQQNYHNLQFIEVNDRANVYQKHNNFSQFGEEILYNQFFRNDLENLFLQ